MKARTKKWALVLLLAGLGTGLGFAGYSCLPADIAFGPYVTGVSAEGARVHWVCRGGAETSFRLLGDSAGAKVELQTDPLFRSTDVRHTALLTGLKPGQTHRYVVSAGWGRAEGSFQTPPPPGSRKPFSFVIYGDTQGDPSRISAVAAAIRRDSPAFLVHTGDLTDNGKEMRLWERQFFGPARDLLRGAPIWPARGNHEDGAEPFVSLFRMPSDRLWYSFDYDNLHVVVLDQWEYKSGLSPMEPNRLAEMVDWLEADLAAAQGRADWIFVTGHQPMFNVAGHGSTWGHEQILPILYKHGVDVATGGHSHLYERFVPIGPSGTKPIHFLVSGGGGGGNYPSVPSPLLVKTYSGLHHILYRIEGGRLEWTAKTPDGTVIDHVVLTKTNGALPKDVLDQAVSPEEAMRLLPPPPAPASAATATAPAMAPSTSFSPP